MLELILFPALDLPAHCCKYHDKKLSILMFSIFRASKCRQHYMQKLDFTSILRINISYIYIYIYIIKYFPMGYQKFLELEIQIFTCILYLIKQQEHIKNRKPMFLNSSTNMHHYDCFQNSKI